MWFGGPFRSVDQLPVENGMLRVVDVRDGSAAERMGVRVGDAIVAINGRQVADYDKTSLFQNLSDRRLRSVEVLRNGERREITFR
jgi:S1-C subfamily serine protease